MPYDHDTRPIADGRWRPEPATFRREEWWLARYTMSGRAKAKRIVREVYGEDYERLPRRRIPATFKTEQEAQLRADLLNQAPACPNLRAKG